MTAAESAARCEFVIQRGQISDLDAILTLAAASPGAARWSRAEYATSCVAAEAGAGHVKALFIASRPASGAVFGFAAFTAVPVAGAYELANMAVAEDHQRLGIGSRLIAAGLLWSRSWGPAAEFADSADTGMTHTSAVPHHADLWLEVRAANRAAISFYENAGFKAAGIRIAYYAHPVEDAIVMRRPMVDLSESGKLPHKSG